MNNPRFTLPLSIVALFASGLLAAGQKPSAVAPRRAHDGKSSALEPAQQPELLSTNYRITFSGKSNETSLGELSSLTCSREIDISGPLSASDDPAVFHVSGTLDEQDGLVIFHYVLNFHIPGGVANQTQVAQGKVAYRKRNTNHSSSGTLKMKPGNRYDVLKAAGNTYTITITAEEAAN